jgi:hypothetical protein
MQASQPSIVAAKSRWGQTGRSRIVVVQAGLKGLPLRAIGYACLYQLLARPVALLYDGSA